MRQAETMKRLAKWTLLVIALVIALWIVINLLDIAFISTATLADYFPEEDQWYCEELQLMVCLGSSRECYIMKNGESIVLTIRLLESSGSHPKGSVKKKKRNLGSGFHETTE